MGFLRVVEVFPPLFPMEPVRSPLALEGRMERFLDEVRNIRSYGDIFLVASVKNSGLLKVSTVEAAYLLRDRIRVDAAPVVVVRDFNRLQFLSTIVTAFSVELSSVMIAWGDRYPSSSGVTNVRDYNSLGEALREVSLIKRRARSRAQLFAPLDLRMLENAKGVAQARDRLAAGADYFLAQPPTTDADEAFDYHSSLLKSSGLKDRVLLNVFPFRDAKDVEDCEEYFGWKLPRSLHEAAEDKSSLVKRWRDIVRRLQHENYPGVYFTTRGKPSSAEIVLSR